jgi:sulfide dehydrogenase [flavocytochrome c] flavoprotein subunit
MSVFVSRRSFGRMAIATAALGFAGHGSARAATGRVVVIGAGFGGATAARFIRRADPGIEVTLIERSDRIVTCPFSNLVLGGLRGMDSITFGFEGLRRDGIRLVRGEAVGIDPARKAVRLADGTIFAYDKLVVAPGIDLHWSALDGYDEAAAELAPHAWKAGPQTMLLRRQLEAMPDGGLVVMVAPDNPFRCPPGPYERASMIAWYLKTHKPRSKILILDAKDAFSKQGLFQDAWAKLYPGMIEWVPLAKDGKVIRVDARALVAETEFGSRHKADVLNVIPPQSAGAIARHAGLADGSGWVPVEPRSFEARRMPDVHVVGDATIANPMPKSGFVANSQGKVVAAAIVAALNGRPAPDPSWINTCYSTVAPDYGISIAGIYTVGEKGLAEVPGSGGTSPRQAADAIRLQEARFAKSWYQAITADTWG